MKSIKVAYQSTVRRFTVDTITWLELESKLRELFSLPSSFIFSLSYTDEEGDVITLSTDLELQELLSQPPQSALKFVIIPERNQPPVVDILSNSISENGFVSIEKEILIPDNVSVDTETDEHDTVMDALDEPSFNPTDNVSVETETDKHDTVMDASDEPPFNPTISSTSKGKQKDESPSTYETNEQEQEKKENPSPNNNEQRPPFIELAEQFQKLLDQCKDILSKNPQLVEQANAIMDQILQNIPVDINQWAEWVKTFRPEGEENSSTTNNKEGESNNPRGNPRGHPFGPFPPGFLPSPQDLLSNPWVQRIAQDVSGNLENFTSPGFNGPWNFNGGCPFQPFQQQQQQQEREGLSQEELKEKINLLHSMGFWEDDVKNEELLKKYNGDVEKVVETLIGQQTERDNDN